MDQNPLRAAVPAAIGNEVLQKDAGRIRTNGAREDGPLQLGWV
jgi:hypothetical protein